MKLRRPDPTSLAARLSLRATYFVFGVAAASSLAGCPVGADLENPELHPQAGVQGMGVGGATGATAGIGGATGGAGAAQGGSAGTPAGGAGAGGSAGAAAGGSAGGSAGTGSGSWVWNCGGEVKDALKQNCARTGCHSALDKFAGLDLTDPASIAGQMVDKPATFGDIGCNAPGMPYRACTADELTALGCPPNVKLIDSANLDASWVLTKLNGMHGMCGDAMPIAPGNSATNGWDAAGTRKQCYIDFFRSLATAQ